MDTGGGPASTFTNGINSNVKIDYNNSHNNNKGNSSGGNGSGGQDGPMEIIDLVSDDDNDDVKDDWRWQQRLQDGQPIYLGDDDDSSNSNNIPIPLHEFPVFNVPKKNGFRDGGEDLRRYMQNRPMPSAAATSTTSKTPWLPKKRVKEVIVISCSVCGKGFYQKTSIWRHMRTVHGIGQTKPTLKPRSQSANIGTKKVDFLGQGLILAPTISQYDVGITSKSVSGNYQQPENSKQADNGYEGEEPCFICGLVFSNVSQLEMHEKIHADSHLASSNESEPVAVNLNGAATEDKELKDDVVNSVGVKNVVDDDHDDDDDDHDHINELQPMEMESNDIEIPLSECPASEPTYHCDKCRQSFWDDESLHEHCLNDHNDNVIAPPQLEHAYECKKCGKKLSTLEAFTAHRHGRGPGRPRKTAKLAKPKFQAKGFVFASGKRPGRKLKPRNEDGTIKVTPPAVVRQNEEIRIPSPQGPEDQEGQAPGSHESQRERERRLRPNPKRKKLDEYESEVTSDSEPKIKLNKNHKKRGPKPKPKPTIITVKRGRGRPKIVRDPPQLTLEHSVIGPVDKIEAEPGLGMKKAIIQQKIMVTGNAAITEQSQDLTALSES